MSLFGFTAGATNENTGVTLIAIVLAYIVYYKIHKIKIRAWILGGLTGNIAGCIFLLTSPGQLKRMETAGGIDFSRILTNIVRISLDFVGYFSFLIVIFILMISFYILIKCDKKKSKEYIYDELDKFSITLIYILGFLGASYSMIMSPFFPDRVWSGPLILLLIAFLSFYNSAFTGLHIKYLRNMQLIFVASLSIISIAVYGRALHELEKVDHQNSVRTAMLENCSNEGKKVIYLPTIRSKSKYSCFDYDGDLSWSPNEWANSTLEHYYGVSKIFRDDSITLE